MKVVGWIRSDSLTIFECKTWAWRVSECYLKASRLWSATRLHVLTLRFTFSSVNEMSGLFVWFSGDIFCCPTCFSANHLDPAGHPPHAAGAGRSRHGAAGLRPPTAEGWDNYICSVSSAFLIRRENMWMSSWDDEAKAHTPLSWVEVVVQVHGAVVRMCSWRIDERKAGDDVCQSVCLYRKQKACVLWRVSNNTSLCSPQSSDLH